MSNRTSASRYARALFDVAQNESDPVTVQQQLAAVVDAVDGSAELAKVLQDRRVPEPARRKIAIAVAERLEVVPAVGKLLALLVERGRFELLHEIAAVYDERLREFRNIVQADVQTAVPLAPDAERALEAALAQATGKQVAMRVTVDASLLGGVVARVGSTVYDGSVRTQLRKMRDQLVAQG